MAMSQSEIYSLALAVGLTPERAKVAAAVAMPESGGDPNAHNTNTATGDNSYGLWQINMIGDMGPTRRKQFGISSNDELFNPAVNAKAMKIVSQNGGNFTPWTTYMKGKHLPYLNNVVTDETKEPGWPAKLAKFLAGNTIAGPALSATGATGITDIKGAYDLLGKAAGWVSNSENWVRVGYVVGGTVVGVVGLVMILTSSGPGKAAAKVAAGVTPVGRIVKK